jgi:transposase
MANRSIDKVETIKEIARLKELSRDQGTIAELVGINRKTVGSYIRKLKDLNLDYQKLKDLEPRAIHKILFPQLEKSNQAKKQPDWNYIYQEKQKKNVTLQQLWYEFIDDNPDGISYSRFTKYFSEYCKKLNPSMRQHHIYGEKCFLDFAGHTIPIVNKETGEVKKAQIFVATLGASNYTYARASLSQTIEDWIYCNQKAFEFFGGVTKITVPDNLKAAVVKADRYEPQINKSYQEFAVHYGTAIIPTRSRKPKDKAKVEVAVQVVERWILAALRNHTFFSLAELNQEIFKLLEILNSKQMKTFKASRKELFEKYEKEKLKALPKEEFEFSEWKKAKVHTDYHVELEGHYYSVPCHHRSSEVEISFNSKLVAVIKNGSVIARHQRSYDRGKHSTIKEHMPKNHQEYGDWTPERIISWAKSTGSYTEKLVKEIIESKQHPAQGFRVCMGVINLTKRYEKSRIEKAAARLLSFGIGERPLQSIKSILVKNLEQEALPEEFSSNQMSLDLHENIRGAEYYS